MTIDGIIVKNTNNFCHVATSMMNKMLRSGPNLRPTRLRFYPGRGAILSGDRITG
jgi:hypothetical protein